ncbi:relaxase/mobilization nuclease domain-containing protein [Nostocaceae cyanobacterium CENA369]|uniref:Relaxase/mobilization nuclease domain-containing protein n=1 Tax=Dendronalium phyllosphericum CENA369 TaxID=1725256 RepID=A0A8J7LQM2_9NOST|nr:relaxase/mobilization nuclease domain-containing protein [Dendronalium phyllosphericum]MBH8578244.1 relaxase/mobilization nuclease domain-containing protein [Dendronalium phyllosphericum CENA369]
MIGNQTKGRGFRGLLNYLQSQEGAKLIGGNMGGRNPRALAVEFKISRQLNYEADRVVYHASLSLPQGERLDDATWNEIAQRYLEEMGFDSNQYVVYRHSNTQHDHIHICASRIRLDNGKIVHDSWDYKRSESIIRQLERDYGLQQTHSSHDKLTRNPSIGQQRRLEREQLEYIKGDRLSPQERPIKQQLIELIDRATVNRPIMPQVIERLQLQGVEVRHGVTRNGKSKGISYSWNGQKFSGTSLGPAYTWPGLQKHKEIDYQPQRDDERIEQLLHNHVGRAVDNQELINVIVNYIEQSAVESVLVETLPQLTELTEQLSLYQQQLKAERTTFDDLRAVIAQQEQQLTSQKAVDAIVDYIDSRAVESALVETLPKLTELTEQLLLYQQQLKEERTTLDDLRAVIAQQEQQLISQKAVDAIVNYIDSRAVESALVEGLPQFLEQLHGHQQQLKEGRIALNDLSTAITDLEQQLSLQKAVDAIANFIEQSVVESALIETLPQLTEQLSQYRQQLKAGKTTFDDLFAVIVYLEQLHRSQKAVDANALNKASTLTTDQPKLKEELRAELYKYYSTDLQNLLVTDRDKEIATLALLDNKSVEEVEEIILGSPAGWTADEAKALVLIANNQLASKQEQPSQQLDQKQQLQSEYLAFAVPVAVELINWQLRESGSNSLRFKRATLEKQGRELVFTHDERGEIFRVAVNRNQSGELEYSPINVGSVDSLDLGFWREAERVLQQIIEEKRQQERRQSRGRSL